MHVAIEVNRVDDLVREYATHGCLGGVEEQLLEPSPETATHADNSELFDLVVAKHRIEAHSMKLPFDNLLEPGVKARGGFHVSKEDERPRTTPLGLAQRLREHLAGVVSCVSTDDESCDPHGHRHVVRCRNLDGTLPVAAGGHNVVQATAPGPPAQQDGQE